MAIVRIIKHWEVDIFIKGLAEIKDGEGHDFVCISEPKKLSDCYELKFASGKTVHIMTDILENISWKPIYED